MTKILTPFNLLFNPNAHPWFQGMKSIPNFDGAIFFLVIHFLQRESSPYHSCKLN